MRDLHVSAFPHQKDSSSSSEGSDTRELAVCVYNPRTGAVCYYRAIRAIRTIMVIIIGLLGLLVLLLYGYEVIRAIRATNKILMFTNPDNP